MTPTDPALLLDRLLLYGGRVLLALAFLGCIWIAGQAPG